MAEHPYEDVRAENLILRDLLAVDRTALAIERTLLAYVRTALSLIVVGVSAIKFFASPWFEVLGWAFVVSGVITGVWGWVRCERVQAVLRPLSRAARAASRGAGK